MRTTPPRSRRPRRDATALVVCLAVGLHLVAAGMPASAQTKGGDRDDARSKRAREMDRRAGQIKVYKVKDGKNLEVPRREQPLLRYSDPTRDFFDGTVWAWGTSGRPVAIVTFERHESIWTYEVLSLAADGIAADLPTGQRWAPRKPGLEWQALPDAPAPADGEAQRLRQMKTLMERFSASEMLGSESFELRRMPTPIHRYSDRDSGIRDGAMFLLVYGTNPEVLVLIECREAGEPKWYFNLSRLTAARVTVRLDGREVWTKPQVRNPEALDEPYAAFHSAAQPE